MWSYLAGNVQKGPVNEEELQALRYSGQIDDNTLVWREGMAEWQPYSKAKNATAGTSPAADGQVVCAECGRSFPPDQVIQHGNSFICATCKPIFLQKLREGVVVAGAMNYAGFWIRVGAYLIDLILLECVTLPLSFVIRAAIGAPVNPAVPNLTAMFINTPISVLIVASYYTFFVGKYGATPGKMATKIRVVNADGSPVGYGKACGRYFAQIISALACCIGYIMIAFDDQKRGLHDRICNTRVIRK